MADAVSPQVLSSLIGSIYDCTLDPDRWEPTLAGLRDAFDGQVATLALVDSRHDRILINRNVGMDPYWVERLPEYAPEINQLTVTFGSTLSLDEPMLVSRHVPQSYWQTSPYFQECYRRDGIVDIFQYFLMRTPTRYSAFAVNRHERQGIVTDCELNLGGLLLPHLRRAVTISNVLDARTIERARLAEALDALNCGVVLADERSIILHANRSAEEMLRDGGPIQATRGVLTAKAPAAAKELRAAIQLAAKDEADIGKTGLAIRLTDADAVPVFAHVLPMTGSDVRTRLQPAAAAAVFIGAADEQDGAETMAKAYGLTPAETRVLANLLTGRTLAGTAAALNVAGTTAKTHLENIFSKTGVTRQAELILLATRAAPPARPTT
jgi:DNA-binding CsgD family transcriptional regulator/PAS domain-containing protein